MEVDPREPALTAPGEPFEIREELVRGRPMRVFARASGTLSGLFATMPGRGDTDFIVDGDRRLSYAAFHALAGALAAALADGHGIRTGDRVALAMHNSPEWMVAFVAVSALGAIPALVNSRGSGEEMRFCVDDVARGLQSPMRRVPRCCPMRDTRARRWSSMKPRWAKSPGALANGPCPKALRGPTIPPASCSRRAPRVGPRAWSFHTAPC